jgi:hypothetical protein
VVLKKYLPFILFIAAAALLFWIKTNQRGEKKAKQIAVENTGKKEPFVRDTALLVYSRHAKCRMGCRQIDKEEVQDILLNGKINFQRVEEDAEGITYPIEGLTQDRQYVRIVFAPKTNAIVVVTAIDLEKEWPCDCN